MAPQLVAARTVLAGVTGGIVSEVSGGSFANGAYTAAFQHLFNAEAENLKWNGLKKKLLGFRKGDKFHQFNKEHGIIAPDGVDLIKNHQLAEKEGGLFGLTWFKRQVQNKGPWDYKQLDPDFQNFGNFHFGLVAQAAGIPEGFALRQAGRAQIAAGTSRPEWGTPGPKGLFGGNGSFGDDPVDQYYICRGYEAGRFLSGE